MSNACRRKTAFYAKSVRSAQKIPYTADVNRQRECTICPSGSYTDEEGMIYCIRQEENRIPLSLKGLGYTFFCVNCALALTFIVWMLRNKDDPVVRIGQLPFMLTICLGSVISSSSIVALSIEPGEGEQTSSSATIACRAIPFLYTIGWILQFSSLSAKSYRLSKIVNNLGMQRRVVKAKNMIKIIVIPLLLDLIIVVIWTIIDPLEYVREIESIAMDGNIQIVESYGQCNSQHQNWFILTLALIHFALMVGTNIILFNIREVTSRYQERIHVTLACAFVAQVLVVGLPILFAVGTSTEAVYLVLSAIVFLNDFAILCFIFIPKMRHQQEGLPEGVNTAQSILSTDMKKAETAYEVKRQSKAYSSMYSTHSTNDRPSHILSTAPMELSERNTTGFVEPVAEETPDDNSSFSSIEDGDASVADEKEGIALYNES